MLHLSRFLGFGLVLLAGCDDAEQKTVIGVGRVSISSSTTSGEGFVAYRRFWNPGASCPADVLVGENCALSNCAYDVSDVPPAESAGTVTVTGGAQEIVFTPGDVEYEPFQAEGPLFGDDDELTFEVAGDGTVEPARAVVVAPPRVSVTSPVLAELTEIDRSQPLTVTWAPIEDGNVIVSANVQQSDGDRRRSVAFYCNFSSWLGTGQIPAAQLQKLPSTVDGGEGRLWIGTQSTKGAVTGSWEHGFSLAAYEAATVTFR